MVLIANQESYEHRSSMHSAYVCICYINNSLIKILYGVCKRERGKQRRDLSFIIWISLFEIKGNGKNYSHSMSNSNSEKQTFFDVTNVDIYSGKISKNFYSF